MPAHTPSGPVELTLLASDRIQLTGAYRTVQVRVAGTEATLSVATDADIYASGATVETSASVRNGGFPLAGAGLHLEIVRPCAPHPDSEETSFHFETWDGQGWVERAVRHRGPLFETDQVDLTPYWPDPDGEYKVRIRHVGALASLDFVSLVSDGALVAPTAAAFDWGGDFLAALLAADDSGVFVTNSAMVVRFPPSPEPSLLYRASEGETSCQPLTLWQKDVPLDLGPGEARDLVEGVPTSSYTGRFVLSGTVRTRDGDVLAQATKTFDVVGGTLAVSVSTDAAVYRTGSPVLVNGALRNLGPAEEEDASFQVSVRGRSCDAAVHSESVSLAAGESRPYSLSFVPSDVCPGETDLAVAAYLFAPSTWAYGEWPFRTSEPSIDVRLEVPDPPLRAILSSPSLVAVEEADLDAVSHGETAALDGALPFPVTIGGVVHVGFRQSLGGFVELVPEGQPGPSGLGGGCLEGSDPATVLAGVLLELDPSVSGFVGYKRYEAGTADRAGRVFARDTLVFFWDAPARWIEERTRFQVLLDEKGLVRIDVAEVPAVVAPTEGCTLTGFSMPPGKRVGFDGAMAPLGLRLEGVGRSPFEGRIDVRNDGGFAGTVSLDYGREGGPRRTETLTVPPGEARTLTFTDAVVAPTNYTLQASGDTSLSLRRSVTPSDGLLVRYAGPADVAPGPAMLPVVLTKTGAEGELTVTYTLDSASGPRSLTRRYDLEPGLTVEDAVPFDLVEGAATLSVAAAGVGLESEPVVLRVGPAERVGFVAAAGAVEGGVLSVGADVANTGLHEFRGEIHVEGPGGSVTAVAVPAGETAHVVVAVDLAGATPGENSWPVRLVSAAGVLLAETTIAQVVRGPHMALVSSPEGTAVDPGRAATLLFRLRNAGDQRAAGTFAFQVFDEDRTAGFDLAPGQESEITFDVEVADDVEEKPYPGRYRIAVAGLKETTGQVTFTVKGIALHVAPSLDREAYRDAETARLTVAISNERPGLGADYLVRVHYGGYEEVQPVTVAGEATMAFDVPLPVVTGEPVFLGISHPDGRSLYINTLHVRRADALASVSLDEQVYAPGATVSVTATTGMEGTLSLAGPGYSETLPLSGSVSRGFALPADLPGGTYFVEWSFTAGDKSASGSVPFDVAGLRVRVFEARLGRGRYETGEAISTSLQIHTNRPASATLRAFVLDPEGLSQLAGETTVTLTPEADLMATHTWPFQSVVGGLHRLVYGLYQPGSDTLLASGSLAFDVGNGAVLGVRTDRAEYPGADAPVQVSVSAFVARPASLRLEVDGAPVSTREVTGTGILELVSTLPAVVPGPHELVAILEGGGYSSRASTAFQTGTSLPDLVPGLPFARRVSGAAWKIDVSVRNAGSTGAAATEIAAFDALTGAVLGRVPVPALAPGTSAVVSVDWNALGMAGSREVEVVADAGQAVLEFREDNNRSRSSVEVPALVVSAGSALSYDANVEADLGASVTNLTADTTHTGLSVLATVIRPDGGTVPLSPVPLAVVPPGATVPVATPWAVGRSAPGAYLFQARLADAAGATLGSSTAAFEVRPTHAFVGTASASPSPAVAGGALHFEGHLENRGNVVARGMARFEVIGAQGSTAAHAATPAEVPLDGGAEVTAAIDPLDVLPGDYELRLEMEVLDQSYPVARSPISVTGAGIEAGIEPDLTPRVLVYVGGLPWDPAGVARRRAFVEASLAGTGVVVETTGSPVEFALRFRSGLWNTYVFMTDAPVLVPLLGDELREAVFRGDGLVFVPWKSTGTARELEPALGLTVGGRVTGETVTLEIQDGPLGPARTLVVRGPATRLELHGASLVASVGGRPVLAMNGFGRGRDVTMGFDPAAPPGDPARPALEALFAQAVLHAAPHEARLFAAGTVMPFAVVLDNPGSASAPVEVALALPSGVGIGGLDDRPVLEDPPTWQVDVPAGGTRTLRFHVALPDQTGRYVVEATVKVSGQALGEAPRVELEVPRTTAESLAQVLADLDVLEVSAGDRGHLESAREHLRQAREDGSGLLGLEMRIRRGAEAAEALGRIQSADVSRPRGEVARLVAAWERASHDLAVAHGQARRYSGSTGRAVARDGPALPKVAVSFD